MNPLEKLYNHQDLNQQESKLVFDRLIQGKLSEIEMTSLLISLKMKGEQPEEIAGAALALRENANFFPTTDYLTADSCGTGGSGMNTVNISTMVAFLLAELGLPMVKNGNRSISSKCGSADVLEQLGVVIDMDGEQAKNCLDKTNFCFLFAPKFHPGVGNVMPIRKQLKTRTIFNSLGPLVNPAKPKIQLMGVYSEELCLPAAKTLQLSGCESAMVVHSGGYDEITLHSPTKVCQLVDNQIENHTFSHQDFQLPSCFPQDIAGTNPEENAKVFVNILKGKITSSRERAIADTVAANASALLKISKKVDSLATGAQLSLEKLNSGDVYERLEKVVFYGQSIREEINV